MVAFLRMFSRAAAYKTLAVLHGANAMMQVVGAFGGSLLSGWVHCVAKCSVAALNPGYPKPDRIVYARILDSIFYAAIWVTAAIMYQDQVTKEEERPLEDLAP